MPEEVASQRASPYYLLGGVAHVHCVINPVIQEAPSVLKVWGGILHHHQLCRVIDASQHSSPGIPVKLQRNPAKKAGHHYCCGLGEVWGGSYPKPQAHVGSLLIPSFPQRYICPPWITLLFSNLAGHQNYPGDQNASSWAQPPRA